MQVLYLFSCTLLLLPTQSLEDPTIAPCGHTYMHKRACVSDQNVCGQDSVKLSHSELRNGFGGDHMLETTT